MRNSTRKSIAEVEAWERDLVSSHFEQVPRMRRMISGLRKIQEKMRIYNEEYKLMEQAIRELEFYLQCIEEANESEHKDNQAYIFMDLFKNYYLTPNRLTIRKAYELACKAADRLHYEKRSLSQTKRRLRRYDEGAVLMARGYDFGACISRGED